MANEMFIRQTHTVPRMVWQVVNDEGCPVDLTSTSFGAAQKATFTMSKTDRAMTPVIIDAPAILIDAAKGLLGYNWTPFDTLFVQTYYCMFSVHFTEMITLGEKAQITYQGVNYIAVANGTQWNTRLITFDGLSTIAQIIAAFNLSNPNYQITSNAADTGVVPVSGTATLVGGVNDVTNERKVGYPEQREDLEMSVEPVHSLGIDFLPPIIPAPGSALQDWLNERFREQYPLVGTKNGVNRIFTVSPHFFTVNESFTIKVTHDTDRLTRGVDFNVASTNTSKLGYNQIIFEEDAILPEAGDELFADFYISDKE